MFRRHIPFRNDCVAQDALIKHSCSPKITTALKFGLRHKLHRLFLQKLSWLHDGFHPLLLMDILEINGYHNISSQNSPLQLPLKPHFVQPTEQPALGAVAFCAVAEAAQQLQVFVHICAAFGARVNVVGFKVAEADTVHGILRICRPACCREYRVCSRISSCRRHRCGAAACPA